MRWSLAATLGSSAGSAVRTASGSATISACTLQSRTGKWFGSGGDDAASQIIGVEELKTQLAANQRSPHTVMSYPRDISMLRRWREAENLPLDVDRLTPPMLPRSPLQQRARNERTGRRASRVPSTR